jgi:twinkle protein
VAGEPGKSLRVSLKGSKPLVWMDGDTGAKGGGLDLWMACRCVPLTTAMAEAMAFIGLRDVGQPVALRPKVWPTPRPRVLAPDDRVIAWFAARGILTTTVKRWRVRGQERGDVVFAAIPSLTRDGRLENVKYRNLADKKDMRQETGCAPALVGKHLLDANALTLVITEGECDAMVLDQNGIAAVSVPMGAGNHEWIAHDWVLLEQLSDIVLCFDDDDAGRRGAAEAARRLGIERCRLMRVGAKDANDWLRAGATREQFLAAVAQAKPIDPAELHSMGEYAQRMKEYFYPGPDAPVAPLLQIDSDFEWYQIRAGAVTLWTGINGHGKSLLLSQVLLGQMRQEQTVCVFSGEMLLEDLLARTLRQAGGTAKPAPDYIEAMCDYYGQRLYVYESADGSTSAPLDHILAVFTHAARRYGVNQFVLDSLMKTDVREDGPGALTAQKEAMNKIVDFAHRHRCHVHVVAHPRKDRDESTAPGKMDVAGSSKLVDQVDGVFSVWKKDDRKALAEPDRPHGSLELLKQRDAGKPQNMHVPLYFDAATLQYRTTRYARAPQRYVDFFGEPVAPSTHLTDPEAPDEIPEDERF